MSDKPTLGLGSPYRWLAEALALCRAHISLFLFAAATLLLVSLLPAILDRVAASLLPPTLLVQMVVYALFSLLILPPLTGGFYRLARATHQGRPVQPRQLFEVFEDGSAARRLVQTNLVFFFILLLGVAMPVAAIGGEPLADYLRELTTPAQGAKSLPTMPEGTAALLSGAMLLSLLIFTAKELAMCQASLSERSPMAAVGDGFRIAFSHAASFLLFYLPVAIIAFLGFLAMAMAAVVLGAALSLISPALTYLLIMPVAVAVGLGYFALVYAFFYRAWQDTLGGDALAPPAEPQASHQIEL
jgi:hypothetical protein